MFEKHVPRVKPRLTHCSNTSVDQPACYFCKYTSILVLSIILDITLVV